MTTDTLIHVILGIGSAFVTGVFTAGVIYTWTKMSITHLEENLVAAVKLLREKHDQDFGALDRKIDKNFETLDKQMDEQYDSLQGDLSGIGAKVTRNGEKLFELITSAGQRYQRQYGNLTTALTLVAKKKQRSNVAFMLKEEAS